MMGDDRLQEVARLRASRDGYRQKLRETRDALRRARHSSLTEYRRSKRKWAVPVHQPMVLISQVQRAGGTLLARLFDSHRECFAHPMELKWGRPAKWNWPSLAADATLTEREAFSSLDEMWVRKAIRQGGYCKYAQWSPQRKVRNPPRYPFAFDRELQLELFSDAYRLRRVGRRRDVLNAYLTSLFNAWLDYQNLYAVPKRWVTCFVPRLIMHDESVAGFFADYPDGKLITIVRHPGSWFASAARHTFSGDPAEILQHWVDSTHASLAAARRYGPRVLVVLFEDLVLNTEATMRAICAAIGLTFQDSLLRPTYNGMPVLSDSSFRLTTAIDPEVTRRYAAVMSPEQVSAIDGLAMQLYTDVAARFTLKPENGSSRAAIPR